MTTLGRTTRTPAWLSAWLSVVLVVVVVVAVSGCGVPVEGSPRTLELTPATSGSETPTPGAATIRLYLVDGDRLAPVERSAADRTLETILVALAEGPTPAESSTDLTTALAPESFTAEVRGVSGRSVVVVTVGDAFPSISGDDQLLATAQLVWTVTELDPRLRVRLVTEDGPLEVVTDRGLTLGAVGRTDFVSVAPVAGRTP